MDELHQLSAILIERETIDRDQFERLLAGEDEANVFPDEKRGRRRSRPPGAGRRPQPKPIPRPFPGRDYDATAAEEARRKVRLALRAGRDDYVVRRWQLWACAVPS